MLLPLIGELHNENTILCNQPDKHDDPDLAEDVQRLSEIPERQQSTCQCEGHCEHDYKRITEAFKLPGENEIDDGKRNYKCQVNTR